MCSEVTFKSVPRSSTPARRTARLAGPIALAGLLALALLGFSAPGLARSPDSSEWVVDDRSTRPAASAHDPDGESPITVTGELTILYADDFAHEQGKLLYFLRNLETDEIHELRLAGRAPGHLRSGSLVTARGRAKEGQLYLVLDESGEESIETVQPVQAAVTSEQRTLVVVADFLDASTSCPVADIQDLMFTDPMDQSVDDLYTEISHGAIWFSGDVVGPYTLEHSKDLCNIEAWADAADAAAQADGVNVGLYSRKLYVLPPNACPAAGVATVGGNPSRAWVFTCDLPDVYAHELGHNLGMGHASTPAHTYGDISDVMGLGGWPLRQLNAPHKGQMGWLVPEQIATVTEGGIYQIAPLELDPMGASAPQALEILKPDTEEYYYLSYRRAIGFDENLSSAYLDRLSVHRYSGDGPSRTYLLGQLEDNQSFVDAINGITITQLSHDDDVVTLEASFGSVSEVGNTLRVDRSDDLTTLSWEPVAGLSQYNVYRGYHSWGRTWSYNQQCVGDGVQMATATDPLDPRPFTLFYYLVSGEGVTESVLGRNSNGEAVPQPYECPAVTLDHDGDGTDEASDNCPGLQNPSQLDSDADGHGDPCDNCPTDSNPTQWDADADGSGNMCDDDLDGDGWENTADNCPNIANPGQEDIDLDGIGDACDA